MARRALLPAAYALLAASALAGPGASDGDAEAKARAEVELQLKRAARIPPPSLEVRFNGIDSPRYELLEASFALDGVPFKTQPAPGPGEKKGKLLFFGIVTPGEHVVTASVTYKEVVPENLFAYAGYRFTLPGRYTVAAQNGLVMVLRAWVEVNDGAADLKQRLELVASAEPIMVAKMADDSSPQAAGDAPVKIRAGSWRNNATVTGAPMAPQKP